MYYWCQPWLFESEANKAIRSKGNTVLRMIRIKKWEIFRISILGQRQKKKKNKKFKEQTGNFIV